MSEEGEEALVAAMKETWVGYPICHNPTRTTDGGSESQNSFPGGLQRKFLPEAIPMRIPPGLMDYWTTQRELLFPVGRRTRRRNVAPTIVSGIGLGDLLLAK